MQRHLNQQPPDAASEHELPALLVGGTVGREALDRCPVKIIPSLFRVMQMHCEANA